MSNNGNEWAARYSVMLPALFFLGGGRWINVNHRLARYLRK